VSTVQQNHPFVANGLPSSIKEKILEVESQINLTDTLSSTELFFILQKIFISLGDPMSTLHWSNSDTLRSIELPFQILYNVDLYFIISQNTTFASPGFTIVSWNGKPSFSILKAFIDLFPHTNIHLLRSVVPQLLVLEPYLRHLGLVNNNDEVPLTIESNNGKLESVYIPLKNITNSTNNLTIIEPHYYQNEYTAALELRDTQWDEDINLTLESIFDTIVRDRITKVVIDVRNNRGVSPLLVSILMYKLWPNFVNYGIQLRNPTQFQQFFPGIDQSILKSFLEMNSIDINGNIWEIPGDILMNLITRQYNITDNNQFLGQVYIVLSPDTRGCANLFAKILKDTGTGKTVGTPTGFTWNYYGLSVPYEFQDMNDFYFTVSTARFFTPNSPTSTILPDILISNSKYDITYSNDPQTQYILSQ
jgi:hypothetical protein